MNSHARTTVPARAATLAAYLDTRLAGGRAWRAAPGAQRIA